MCGLVASITKDTYCTNLDDWFKDALIASQLRGVHSTGMFQVTQAKQILNFKKATNASNFVEDESAKALLTAAPRSPITVGHVRHATQGGIKDENAHPFVFVRESDKSRVVGVHNGTLLGWRNKEGGDKQDVDSAWAFQKFAEEGPIDAFEYFSGAFAFIWYDSRHPNHLWTARNEQRPLHFFQTEDDKTLLFASELGMLGWVTERNKFKLGKGERMFFTEANKIYKFSLTDIGKYEIFDMPKYDPTTNKVTTVPQYPSQQTNLTHYRRHWSATGYDDSYDDSYDDIPWGSSGRRGWDDQDYVLSKVKNALRGARYRLDEVEEKKSQAPVSDDKVVTASDLEDGIRAAIDKYNSKVRDPSDVWMLAGDGFRIPSPNDRDATTAEIKRAKDLKVHGIAVAYSGVLYDDESSENLGDAYVSVNGACKQYDCLLRGLSKSAADAKYNESGFPSPLVIVGVTDGINKGDLMFIVAELSPEQRENLWNRIDGVKQIQAERSNIN